MRSRSFRFRRGRGRFYNKEMRMRVVAVNRFEYANKLRLPGDEFDTESERDAELMILAQQVKKIDTRMMQADKDKPKRYRHRAMRVADE
jgi:hypothetical protein